MAPAVHQALLVDALLITPLAQALVVVTLNLGGYTSDRVVITLKQGDTSDKEKESYVYIVILSHGLSIK